MVGARAGNKQGGKDVRKPCAFSRCARSLTSLPAVDMTGPCDSCSVVTRCSHSASIAAPGDRARMRTTWESMIRTVSRLVAGWHGGSGRRSRVGTCSFTPPGRACPRRPCPQRRRSCPRTHARLSGHTTAHERCTTRNGTPLAPRTVCARRFGVSRSAATLQRRCVRSQTRPPR